MFIEKTKKFPYVIPEERKTRILNNYAQLRIGMTKEEVLALLGEPDIEEKIYPKFGNPTTILGWCWDYFFYKFDSYHENLGKDQEIYIIYGINNKVKEVVASNISGLIGIK
jgi:outer membrane protein assembly factor BamE (lipoprotein component of BamABCDE complex)